jgi:hypothetical protein
MTINSVRQTYKDFFTECPQLFALFNACDSSKEAAERALNRLSQDCRSKIFKKVCTAAGKPATTDAQWGEHNALEDLPRLQDVLKRIARKIFGSLDISQQRRAEDLAYEHAGRLATDDPEWGRGNVLLHSLADTQMLECVELWAKEVRAQHSGLDDSLAAVSTEIRRFLADPSATRLNLSELHLPSLPPVFDLEPFTTRLQQLDCFGNWLTALPSQIGNCIALRELYCSNNRLTELPREIGNCLNLQKLYCYNNQLTVLPSEIGNCTNLQRLICSDNQLTELPSQIGNCTNLQRLYCSNNQLTALPTELLHLPQECIVVLTGRLLSEAVLRRLCEATEQPNYQGPRIFFSMGGGRG